IVKSRRPLRFALGVLALLASGCATGLGPKAVRSERPDYNHQIRRSGDAELLLNLVRLRYNDSPLFLDLGTIVAQYGYDASLNASGTVGAGDNTATIGTGLSYSEKPTITSTPLTGDQCATRMLTPIALESFMLFEQTGWSGERLMLIGVQRVNDLFNAPTASGPPPKHMPDYAAFAAPPRAHPPLLAAPAGCPEEPAARRCRRAPSRPRLGARQGRLQAHRIPVQ